MEKKTRYTSMILAMLILGAFIPALATPANAAIARIAKFSGEVVVKSGDRLNRVTTPGALLDNGDLIQTKQGEAEILFNDGAVMKINPFSNTMLQEREEESRFLFFKSKATVRRITCLVGKFFFQSGVSGSKNYLQTPTAVAGIRGSSADVGFDNLNTYLHVYSGETEVVGNIIRGLFANPGVTAAQKSTVYQALAGAYAQTQQAAASGRAVDIAQAVVTAIQVGGQVALALKANPAPAVQQDGALIEQLSGAQASAASARVSVEQIKEEKSSADSALADALRRGDTEKAKQAELASQKAAADGIRAEQEAAAARAAAAQATAAALQADLEKARKAAEDAAAAAARGKAIEAETRRILQDVVTTTVAPTTIAATTTAETTAATTTAATTVVATTVPQTTTTVFTTSTVVTTSTVLSQ